MRPAPAPTGAARPPGRAVPRPPGSPPRGDRAGHHTTRIGHKEWLEDKHSEAMTRKCLRAGLGDGYSHIMPAISLDVCVDHALVAKRATGSSPRTRGLAPPQLARGGTGREARTTRRGSGGVRRKHAAGIQTRDGPTQKQMQSLHRYPTRISNRRSLHRQRS